MRKAFHIIVFLFILGSLFSMVPPVRNAFEAQLIDSTSTFSFSIADPVFVEAPLGYPSGVQYIRIYTGQIASYESFVSSPAHSTNCKYQHLHTPAGEPTLDIEGEFIEDPAPDGCGLGKDPSSISTSPIEITKTDTTGTIDTGSTVVRLSDTTTDEVTNGNTSTTTTSVCPPSEVVYVTEDVECPPPEIITVPEEATCPPPEEIECPEPDPVKHFDYGAFASRDPRWNLPWDTIDAPHFVSDTRFYSIKIGSSVDAPEYVTIDASSSDQDGLNFPLSNRSGIVLSEIYNVRGKYGTIIVGRWEKKVGFYEFKVLAVVQVSKEENKTPSIFQADGVRIGFETDPSTGVVPEMKEGWLTVIYMDAEGNVDPGVPGSGQLAINGMPNYGFTLAQIKGDGSSIPAWDGQNQTLDQIIYHQILEPFDVSRAPGEVEDYLYCDKGPTGFRYYKPNDPQYATDCGAPEYIPPPEVILNTPTTNTQPINVICNFNNVQNFVCDPNNTGTGTGGIGTTGTGTVTPALDSRPITEILEELITNYNSNQSNNARTRLEIIHKYLNTLLPRL